MLHARGTISRIIAVWAIFFGAAVLLQYFSGAFHSEFGSHPDEPAHVVTALLVRDYLASGVPRHPMRFAENYYAHYPKAALGHWPPVYYALQAVWNLVFPVTRVSILTCQAMITALFVTLCFWWARDRLPEPVAFAAALWLLTQPLIQWLTTSIMLDAAVALFVLLATLSYAEYLRAPGWRSAAWFGVWACTAILTKGTGAVLALLPVFGILLSRRVKLVARASFWLPAVMVLVICGPWYYLAPEALQQRSGAFGAPSVEASQLALMARFWANELGAVLPVLALVGIAASRRVFRMESREDARGLTAIALLCSAVVFLVVVRSTRETRNLAVLMGPLLLFAAAGIFQLVEWIPFRRMGPGWRVALTTAILAIWSGAHAFSIPRKTPAGYSEAAAYLTHAPQYRESVFLISGDPTEEGMFISEVALAERRPAHIVLRASKALSSAEWSGHGYSSKFQQVEPLDAYLRSFPVGILVLQKDVTRPRLHHALLEKMVVEQPAAWRPVRGATTPTVLVYELVGHQSMPRRGVTVRLSDKLGKDVHP